MFSHPILHIKSANTHLDAIRSRFRFCVISFSQFEIMPLTDEEMDIVFAHKKELHKRIDKASQDPNATRAIRRYAKILRYTKQIERLI